MTINGPAGRRWAARRRPRWRSTDTRAKDATTPPTTAASTAYSRAPLRPGWRQLILACSSLLGLGLGLRLDLGLGFGLDLGLGLYLGLGLVDGRVEDLHGVVEVAVGGRACAVDGD